MSKRIMPEDFDYKEAGGAIVMLVVVAIVISLLVPHLKATPKEIAYAKANGLHKSENLNPFPTVKASILHPIEFVKEVMAPFPEKK